MANWTLCELPEEPPNYISFTGSTYWDLGDRVRRWSNHWGTDIASCCWYLDFEIVKRSYCLAGECYYDDFRSIKTLEKEYYN